jgi:hypothetical protein
MHDADDTQGAKGLEQFLHKLAERGRGGWLRHLVLNRQSAGPEVRLGGSNNLGLPVELEEDVRDDEDAET